LKKLQQKQKIDQYIAGLEFIKLTHWDRFVLNENIAILEKQIYPEDREISKENTENEVWRGNRRRHYRLDTHSLNLGVEIDFRPLAVKCYAAKIMDISAAGCCILLPPGQVIDVNIRIPKIQIQFNKDAIICRARVTYVTKNNSYDEA
jgi:hypothetical protein